MEGITLSFSLPKACMARCMARNASWVAFVQIAAGSAIMGAMSVNLKTPQEIEMMRIAGRLASEVLDIVTPHVKPGVTTEELDRICHDHIVNVQGAIPANVGYRGFPKTVCTSVNNVICHGIPSEGKVLKDGDIINIDVTVIKDGWHGDTSRMYFVGTPSVMARRLVETTYEAMWRGIRAVRPGATLGDIGHAIQSYAEGERFSVVREYCGHMLHATGLVETPCTVAFATVTLNSSKCLHLTICFKSILTRGALLR